MKWTKIFQCIWSRKLENNTEFLKINNHIIHVQTKIKHRLKTHQQNSPTPSSKTKNHKLNQDLPDDYDLEN